MRAIHKLVAIGVSTLSMFVSMPILANTYSVYITEWSYQGKSAGETGEYIEISNLGALDVDFTNWSYDDDSRNTGIFSLSSFGVVKAGESVILTDISADAFRTIWNLSTSVKVIGNMSPNLGRADEINIFDANLDLVDRLTYGDNSVGGIRARFNSGVPGSVDVLGSNDVQGWVLSQTGDAEGSWTSTLGDVGSPGQTFLAVTPVPEPESYALMLGGLGLIGFMVRRRKNKMQ